MVFFSFPLLDQPPACNFTTLVSLTCWLSSVSCPLFLFRFVSFLSVCFAISLASGSVLFVSFERYEKGTPALFILKVACTYPIKNPEARAVFQRLHLKADWQTAGMLFSEKDGKANRREVDEDQVCKKDNTQ